MKRSLPNGRNGATKLRSPTKNSSYRRATIGALDICRYWPTILETKAKGGALGERSQIQLKSEKTTEYRGSRTDWIRWFGNLTTLGDFRSLECGACTGAQEAKTKDRLKNELEWTCRASETALDCFHELWKTQEQRKTKWESEESTDYPISDENRKTSGNVGEAWQTGNLGHIERGSPHHLGHKAKGLVQGFHPRLGKRKKYWGKGNPKSGD